MKRNCRVFRYTFYKKKIYQAIQLLRNFSTRVRIDVRDAQNDKRLRSGCQTVTIIHHA